MSGPRKDIRSEVDYPEQHAAFELADWMARANNARVEIPEYLYVYYRRIAAKKNYLAEYEVEVLRWATSVDTDMSGPDALSYFQNHFAYVQFELQTKASERRKQREKEERERALAEWQAEREAMGFTKPWGVPRHAWRP